MDKVTIFRPKLIVAQEISLSWLRLPTCTDKILVPQYSIFNPYTDYGSGRIILGQVLNLSGCAEIDFWGLR